MLSTQEELYFHLVCIETMFFPNPLTEIDEPNLRPFRLLAPWIVVPLNYSASILPSVKKDMTAYIHFLLSEMNI